MSCPLSLFPATKRFFFLVGLRAGAWLLAALVIPTAAAFPPSPNYTLYGIVRDDLGATLQVAGAEIVLLKGGAEIGRGPVLSKLRGDLNYELIVRIDHDRPNSRIYNGQAVPAQGIFSLVVELNGQRFYPIEVNGTLRAGNGGERVRLDLNLGADTDGDGLPDAWEAWQLYQAGRQPGPNGWDLSLINRDGDFDGDGTSNYREYVAGTYAGDVTENFELTIRGKTAATVEFEFFGITGKVYAIQESMDLSTWEIVPLALTPTGTGERFHEASSVGVIRAYVTVPTAVARFYRLTVR